MQQMIWLAGTLASPTILIVVVWCGTLAGVTIGPIDYPKQPSAVVLAVVVIGIFLFVLACRAGGWCFDNWFKRLARIPAASARTLNRVTLATSLLGIAGIALIVLDRTTFSGVGNSGYSELLRCAPGLVDSISIKRTPLLYLGYVTFSFGFASVVLFLLKGEEVGGWAAALAQLSVLSPIGYALLYSGRMPILFVLVLMVSAALVRMSRGQLPLPAGHHLILKIAIAIGMFAIYSSSVWLSRQNFCNQVSGLVHELQQEKEERRQKDSNVGGGPARRPTSTDAITGADLSKRVAEAEAASAPTQQPNASSIVLDTMLQAWNVKPRGYVTSAINSGLLLPHSAMTVLSTYFYLTHGVRTIDIVWHARQKFTPQWGVYEIGLLSPVLRVFFPTGKLLANMEEQQKAAQIYGFFPTVWVAAFVDFGISGAIIYVLAWGFVAGWSAIGVRRSASMMPPLLLVFILASIVLSTVQGPLGVANSALVLLSLLVTGIATDFLSLRSASEQVADELQRERSST